MTRSFEGDRVEIDRRFAASLVAHAFFSTFPRRTVKTHPTLQDFNFAGHFFQHLNRRSQRAKLRSILHYFQRLNERPPEGHVTFARQYSRIILFIHDDEANTVSITLHVI
ncbi:hypothetical protein OUZ56_006977 [Daphnia magna]|uniref:PARG helical domain-containing protein n=1 Tax=Daphnia magna TaxID=35525 RepID=A0ABQ9YX89_9CRUS|nr:hypothetical protein OUZ56_006977 [Daphnia magna]